MAKIRRLPQSVINKIAAGEVIERPASVVKELVENSLDAGATRIDVAVAKGGIEFIRVADNGCGIAFEDLELAVASHATSKIGDAEDLFHVRTLGFRGEALASIAEVSHLRLRSRTPDSDSGGEIYVEGGLVRSLAPCGCPVGTVVEVRQLFFNTPVRRKFLRSTTTELGHISETVAKLALAHFRVHFTLTHNDRPVLQLPAAAGLLERIAALYGQDLADSLIPVSSEDGPVRLYGYVAHPAFSRPNAKMQFLFLNGRAIRDRNLQHALNEAYRGLLTVGRQPVAFLVLEMPPEMVDVNVHPTKQEVRFLDSGRLYSQLLGTLRREFLSSDLSTRIPAPTPEQDGDSWRSPHDPEKVRATRQQIVEWAKGELQQRLAGNLATGSETAKAVSDTAHASSHSSETARPALRSGETIAPGEQRAEHKRDLATAVVELRSAGSGASDFGQTTESLGRKVEQGAHPELGLGSEAPAKVLQIHNRYLITESDEGLVVIDQHALHERILYEQLRQSLQDGPLTTQQLLIPEPVDLSPVEAALALENKELLAELGLSIEPFGGTTVLVHSYPAMLRHMSAGDLLRSVLAALAEGRSQPDRATLLDSILHSLACKAAIKAGERLAPEQVRALLEQSRQVLHSHHCPHGRPTMLVFSREELDRYFRRT
ncbi:DNA mismatch repair endonuclease MutL [Thermogutta sp.]|uniref:DNA mismatch repair endonuclease MutL n=1 Tax=Thermogutta sp. TaxID=1962930 RepID=UPI003C7C27AF